MFDRETSPDEFTLVPRKGYCEHLVRTVKDKTMSLINMFVGSAAADNRAERGSATESQGRGLVKQELVCC
jgi:hypothetical protein